jgi:hypothetical protein
MNGINALSGRGLRFLGVAAFLLGSRLTAAEPDAASASGLRVAAALDPQRGTLAMPGSGKAVGALLDDLHGGLRQKVLNLDSSSPTLLFPVLGKIPGWQSDVMLLNYQNTPQRIAFLFMELGANNASRAPLYYTLPANQFVYWHDFFPTGLGITGIGAIIVTGVDAFGNPDTAALLDGSARLYQTNSAGGTLSQLFPSVPLLDVPSGSRVTALGLRSDSHFRTNAGVVNPDGFAHTFTVSIVGPGVTTFQVTVLPYSMMQVPIPNGGTYGDIALQFTSDSGSWWSAYGASVDNVSGDSWSAHGALAN